MEITLTLQDLGFIAIGVALFVLICYGIAVLKNLLVTVKHTNQVLTDMEEISKIAAARAGDLDKAVDEMAQTVSSVSATLKGNGSSLKAITNMINAATSLIGLLKSKVK